MKHFDAIVVVSACLRWWWWRWWWWYLTLWTLPMTTYNWLAATGWLWLADCTTYSLASLITNRQCWSPAVRGKHQLTPEHQAEQMTEHQAWLIFNSQTQIYLVYSTAAQISDDSWRYTMVLWQSEILVTTWYPLFQSSAVQPPSRSYLVGPTPSSGISGMSLFSSICSNITGIIGDSPAPCDQINLSRSS